MVSDSITTSTSTIMRSCKHRLPCGWCEVRNMMCNSIEVLTYPYNYEKVPLDLRTVQVYAAPSGDPIITTTSSNGQKSYVDWELKRE